MRALADDVLIAVVSGKRPGRRTTEKFTIDGDAVIISNDSTGYTSHLPIVDVPQPFRDWYAAEHALSAFGNAVPMSRSYAVQYARENGYRYLVQLDDNIHEMRMAYLMPGGGKYQRPLKNITPFMNGLADVLRHTNAGLAGMNMNAAAPPEKHTVVLRERYVYSVLALDLAVTPPFFGDIEEDIGMRLQLARKGIPTVQVIPFRYSKQGQLSTKDTSGNRAAYDQLGAGRGAAMAKLYGDVYARGVSNRNRNLNARGTGKARRDDVIFRHKLKPFKVGLKADNTRLSAALREAFNEIRTAP